MASPYVPGPAPIFVGLGGSAGQPAFLGFSERGVHIDINPMYSDYIVDLGGAVPLDKSYQGATATVSFDLTRWNEDVLAAMDDFSGSLAGSSRGVDVPGEIGTLMSYEGAAYTLWIVFPYSNFPAYADMPAGYRFPKAFIDRETLPERGSKPAKVHLIMTCLRDLDMTTINDYGRGKLTLYDNDMSAISLSAID